MRPQELIYQQGPRADPGELMASRWRGREEPGPWGTVMNFTREFRGGTVGSKVWVRDAKGQWEGKEGFVSWRSGRSSLRAAGCGLTRGSGEVSCHTSRVKARRSQGLDGGPVCTRCHTGRQHWTPPMASWALPTKSSLRLLQVRDKTLAHMALPGRFQITTRIPGLYPISNPQMYEGFMFYFRRGYQATHDDNFVVNQSF